MLAPECLKRMKPSSEAEIQKLEWVVQTLYSEQGVHQFHAIGHCRLGQYKADKALEGHLWALDLSKAAAGLDYAHHEKEHQ